MNILAENSGLIRMHQRKSFAASIFVHLFIVLAVFSATSRIQQEPKLMVVDFSVIESVIVPAKKDKEIPKQQTAATPPLVKQPEKVKPPTPPKPIPEKRVVKKIAKTVPVKKIKIAEKTHKPVPTVKPEPLIEPEPESYRPVSQVQKQEPLVAKTDAAPTTQVQPAPKPLPSFPAPAAGKPKADDDKTTVSQYTKAQFSHIQKGIQNQINYPLTARRMGWEGKVVVEFVICKDGTVKDLQIIESSGFKALDKNAVATIKKAAPFPIPPTPAKLIIPVVYRLS